MIRWFFIKWFWLVRNTVAAARLGWEGAAGVKIEKTNIPDLGKFRG